MRSLFWPFWGTGISRSTLTLSTCRLLYWFVSDIHSAFGIFYAKWITIFLLKNLLTEIIPKFHLNQLKKRSIYCQWKDDTVMVRSHCFLCSSLIRLMYFFLVLVLSSWTRSVVLLVDEPSLEIGESICIFNFASSIGIVLHCFEVGARFILFCYHICVCVSALVHVLSEVWKFFMDIFFSSE